jgi:hypothetical protein
MLTPAQLQAFEAWAPRVSARTIDLYIDFVAACVPLMKGEAAERARKLLLELHRLAAYRRAARALEREGEVLDPWPGPTQAPAH